MPKKPKTSAKKSEESIAEEDKKDESLALETESSPTEDQTEVLDPPKDPSPEPIYDEPVLSELIIETFEGDKTRGMYEGEGYALFTGGHTYKGQFCEGLMHGHGQYTWSDGVVYQGEFFQNQVTGKGVYRWPDGSAYDGEVLNGKRHGIGTFKCKNNKLSYSGEWSLGKRHGKGKMDYDSEGRSYYDGDWINNVKHGWGTRQYPSGNIYQGMWFNNIRHGEGTMKWLDRNQMYTGNWENGIQHGVGQHLWMLRRVSGSQYPLRNMYDGDFVNGLRHGFGTFYYANGAKYEGGWKDNMKHGKGKFVFKNGRIYEGMFANDHIVEYPDFTMDGTTTPDISQIRTRTPLPYDNLSVHSNESRNTISPSFQLNIEHLLAEFTDTDREEESSQVLYVVMRHISALRKIYNFYSSLGYDESADNTFVMNKMQFWRFLVDCEFHHSETTLMEMDRQLGHNKEKYELHNPYEKILLRQFVNNLIVLAYHMYKEEAEEECKGPILHWCMSKLISEKILRHACNVKGHFYTEPRRAVNAVVHWDQGYEIYQSLSTPRKKKPYDPAIKMREFLYLMKDLKLINNDLTPKAIIDILSKDDPNVADGEGCCNLELEMTFLEFFEALIGCAEVFGTEAVIKDPTTPRPSTVMTPEQSMFSIPVSRSRLDSQVGIDGAESQGVVSPRQNTASPESQSPTRAVSSADGTTKNGDIAKPSEVHQSISNVTGGGSVSIGVDGGTTSRHESTKDLAPDVQKSNSFYSTHTNATEDGGLMHSSVSVGGHTTEGHDGGEDDEEGVKGGVAIAEQDEEEEDELDEATRQFNFWTHQVHIFFVRKFFPAAEKFLQLRQLVERRNMEMTKQRISETPSRRESVKVN